MGERGWMVLFIFQFVRVLYARAGGNSLFLDTFTFVHVRSVEPNPWIHEK